MYVRVCVRVCVCIRAYACVCVSVCVCVCARAFRCTCVPACLPTCLHSRICNSNDEHPPSTPPHTDVDAAAQSQHPAPHLLHRPLRACRSADPWMTDTTPTADTSMTRTCSSVDMTSGQPPPSLPFIGPDTGQSDSGRGTGSDSGSGSGSIPGSRPGSLAYQPVDTQVVMRPASGRRRGHHASSVVVAGSLVSQGSARVRPLSEPQAGNLVLAGAAYNSKGGGSSPARSPTESSGVRMAPSSPSTTTTTTTTGSTATHSKRCSSGSLSPRVSPDGHVSPTTRGPSSPSNHDLHHSRRHHDPHDNDGDDNDVDWHQWQLDRWRNWQNLAHSAGAETEQETLV